MRHVQQGGIYVTLSGTLKLWFAIIFTIVEKGSILSHCGTSICCFFCHFGKVTIGNLS